MTGLARFWYLRPNRLRAGFAFRSVRGAPRSTIIAVAFLPKTDSHRSGKCNSAANPKFA
jgi:hypothetical protein